MTSFDRETDQNHEEHKDRDDEKHIDGTRSTPVRQREDHAHEGPW